MEDTAAVSSRIREVTEFRGLGVLGLGDICSRVATPSNPPTPHGMVPLLPPVDRGCCGPVPAVAPMLCW